MMKKLLTAAVAATVLAVGALPAAAHVTVQPTEAETGSFSRFAVRVPNERDDAATTKVEVRFPPTLVSVRFQPKEGWARTVERKTLDEPVEVFGEEVTEYVASVTWEGGRIEPDEFDEFGFTARTPDDPGTLEFPALQTYDSGEVVRWIGAEDTEEPAARVTVAAAATTTTTAPAGTDAEEDDEDDDDGEGLGVVLGGTGLGLSVVALAVSLLRRRRQ